MVTLLSLGFLFFIVIMAFIATQASKPGWIIAASAIGTVTTLVMCLLFSWWFLIWAALLALAIYLLRAFAGRFWIQLILVILLIAIAVGGFFFTRNFVNVEKINTEKINLSAPITACNEAVNLESQIHGGKVELDLNDGDPFNYSLTIINPDTPSGNKTLVVLTKPGSIFDVVYPKMYYTSYRLQGTREQAICSTMKIVGENAFAYVYVGNDEGPKGWTNPYLALENYWWSQFEEKQYSEEAITIGVESLPFQLSTTDKNRGLVSVDVLHGQLWNPTPAAGEKLTVVHPNVAEGYTLTVPLGWQGTYWTIADGVPELVQARIIQTSKEVVERDNVSINPNDYGHMILLYCGDPSLVPTTELKIGNDTLNWVTNLDGWVCEVSHE